ncbi:Cobyrinic acid ac-diamide synthase [Candidatus Filomicrobium marinum]|uniref:Cobyrinic acid ac-diamide synthase n=1 Tax=Candidatus Filomicrobium marinum TaxID=1608628 RepID=A0A0D6JA74_9HYPH|nr:MULTISPECIES: ParA family protein [Filomicrobium]MCV0368677.1 ParA family protein [Filomicrobium sp.]CFX00250.1 Cobyrinic acid ac-diamide synthase [Candidatus Filomicrobium marinum]CPR15195.1 Cobyrinic acid ac-diamide synthase [Candidatus Filomicrobium marinum]
MGYFLAVANRKGGVGKSTVSVMLAHAFAVWGGKRVLLIDLDAQSNSSLILTGNAQWIEAQRTSKNVAAYIEDKMYGQNPISDYIQRGVGDIETDDGKAPPIDLLAGSLRFEDMQDELISHYSLSARSFRIAKERCAEHFKRALTSSGRLADIIILDCAPGISNATAAALRLANKVIVPFRPDSVSEFAVDKISTIIEGKNAQGVAEIPPTERRYRCLANYVRPGGQDQIYIETISADHPTLNTQLPMLPDLANAFYWAEERQTLTEKYASALSPMNALYKELSASLPL